MTLFSALDFEWDRASVPHDIPRHSIDRAVFRFRRMLPEYVWDAGRKLSDQAQILNLAESSKRLIAWVNA